jgi:hypothetical protein
LKTLLAIIGGLLITIAIGAGINVSTTNANPENTITTSGGMIVKMGKVLAELPQTNINVGSGANLTVPLGTEAKEVADLLAQAGVKDTDILQGNLTVCLASVVSYKTELNGIVGTKIDKQCRNFTPGMMAATINTFAEDYTKHVVTEYKTKYNFIK